MKKYNLIYPLLILIAFSFSGCKKNLLDKYPVSALSPQTYFKTETDLQLFTNNFYNNLPTADALAYGDFADNAYYLFLGPEVLGTRTTPTTGGGWGQTQWGQLRNINFYLENSYKATDPAVQKHYDGVARFFRAYFYFGMVKMFGDVPWYSHSIETTDVANLDKPRDSRVLVMDSVLNDLNYAIANLPTAKSIDQVTTWTALALKSRVCLYEGTWRKYHTEYNVAGSDKFLSECVSASSALMTQSGYKLYTSTPNKAYLELFSRYIALPDEIILARTFSKALNVVHDVNRYSTSASFAQGVYQHVINSYLMADGTRFTDKPGYNTFDYYNTTLNRDPRLSQTIRTPGYIRIGGTSVVVPDFSASKTGYQYIKFVTDVANDAQNLSYNDLPIFRYGEVLLNYAEALAESGTIAQGDLDLSIKLLRDRVGMPNINLAASNAVPDPYLAGQYLNVSGSNKGIILEIRRERRIELIRESFRYDDLMRWKEGHLMTIPFLGVYFPGVGSYDLDHNGSIDLVLYSGTKPAGTVPQYLSTATTILENGTSGHIVILPGVVRTFDETKDYFYPIPIQQLQLNPSLKQNPGWATQ